MLGAQGEKWAQSISEDTELRRPASLSGPPKAAEARGNENYSLSATQDCTLANAADKCDGSVPPAIAISALPPPFPPT